MLWKTLLGSSVAFIAWLILMPARVVSLNSYARVGAKESAAHPVVLELFTSEGCSSCPPADALLQKLDDAGRSGESAVIAIEEHVDYWNRLGWTDPFSSHDWTERQEQYAHAFHSGVYTPQLVINGRSDLVGSSEREVRQRIADQSNSSQVELRLSSLKVSPNSAQLSIEIEAASSEAHKADLWLAVTERGLHSNVLRGENEGRNLVHAAVLRSLTRVQRPHSDSSLGSATISLDPTWKRENLRFVAFLQDHRSLHILGATAISAPR